MRTNQSLRLLLGACLVGSLLCAHIRPAAAQKDPNLDKVSSSPLPEAQARNTASNQERVGNLLYTPPAGWKSEKAGNITAYIAPDLAAGENFRILVMPGEELEGGFQAAFEKKMKEIRGSLKAQWISSGKMNELKGPQGADALGRTDIIELPDGRRWTCFLCLLHAGKRIEAIVTFGSSSELYGKYLPEVNQFISRVRFANLGEAAAQSEAAKARILAQGEPPLTQEMVDRYNLFFEWLLDAPMTQEQREVIQNALVASWKANNRTEIDTTLKAAQIQEQIEKKSDSERDILRGTLQPQVLEQLRKQQGDESARWVLALYDSAHKTIAVGATPLTRQMADAYIEMLCFMHNQLVGGEPFSATKADKDQFAKALAAAYGKYTPELQKHIASAPLLWAALRYQWPKMSDEERSGMKTKLQAYLKTMAPDYLVEVKPQKPAQQGTPQGSNSAYAAASAHLLSQHNNYVFLSNMMTMRHVAMMNAIGNIGSGGYTYTYH